MSGDLENVWDQREVMDPTTHHLLSYADLECRVLGTFYGSELRGGTGVGHVLTFGSDLSNYYHNHGLKVFKPRSDALERIVNYRDPRTHADAATAMVSVDAVRYASSHRAFQQVRRPGRFDDAH